MSAKEVSLLHEYISTAHGVKTRKIAVFNLCHFDSKSPEKRDKFSIFKIF